MFLSRFRLVILSVTSVIVLSAVLLAGCSGGSSSANTKAQYAAGPFKPITMVPQVFGDTVTIPLDQVKKNVNTRFSFKTSEGTVYFMAYQIGQDIQVRANLCTPCRSTAFRLAKDVLTCESCGTTFKATTGDGIAGACVNYPKALVNYKVEGSNLVMSEAEMVQAFANTLDPGWP